jgi:hypothetical protein
VRIVSARAFVCSTAGAFLPGFASVVSAQTAERRAGLSDIVTVVAGDAFKEIPQLPGQFDLVFLDAIKNDPRPLATIVEPSSEGMPVSVKIR